MPLFYGFRIDNVTAQPPPSRAPNITDNYKGYLGSVHHWLTPPPALPCCPPPAARQAEAEFGEGRLYSIRTQLLGVQQPDLRWEFGMNVTIWP